MDNDDRQVGKILSRREVLALLGVSGAAMLAGCAPAQSGAAPTAAPATAVPATAAAPTTAATAAPATVAQATAAPATAAPAATEPAVAAVPACVVRPEVTEGPYYVDENLDRADIRSDPSTGAARDGAPLLLTFNVTRVSNGSCVPLEGAKVDIWHCDAAGQYSDVTDRSFSTLGQQWLRGYQLTDANGQATFTTIYPGWYPGRAVHIHFKVFPDATSEFTSQLFFDDALSDQVLANAPYTVGGQQRTLNSTDGIYREQLLLTVTPSGDGYAGTFDIGVEA
jgi:protocatechuate 3,4-dioxygenase beta subunit